MERACKRAWRAVVCLSERIGDVFWIPVTIGVFLHFAVPPSWVLDIRAMTVDEAGVVTLIRKPAHGQVRAWYFDDLVGANGTTCTQFGLAEYEDRPDNTVRFVLGPDFTPCLDDRPVAYSASWRPLLLGFLPLRPITMRAEIR